MVRADGFFAQRHFGIVGGEVAFFVIASQACGDKILPGIFAAAGFRIDMIDGQSRPRSAVLALMAVAPQNVLPRENDFLERHADKMRKADDAWKIHRGMRRANRFSIGHADDLRFFHEEQDDRFLHRADRERFVVAVKE